MPTEADFLEAIRQTDDDASRLIFADWLEERGDPRGEFMRIQVELAKWVPDLDRRTALKAREKELLDRHAVKWLGPLRGLCESWRFHRGLMHVTMHASHLLNLDAAAVLRRAWVHT